MKHDAIRAASAWPEMAALMAHQCPPAWTTDPRAVALLEQVRIDQPRRETRFDTYVITRDEWSTYTGPIADELRAIYDANGDATLMYSQKTDDFEPFRWWCDVTVDGAMDAMLGDNPEVLTMMVHAAAEAAVTQGAN